MYLTAIWLNVGRKVPAEQVKLAYVGIEDGTVASDGMPEHDAVLNRLFLIGNDVEFLGSHCNSYRGRSMSTGDFAQIDDSYYRCESTGWRKLDTPPVRYGFNDEPPEVY